MNADTFCTDDDYLWDRILQYLTGPWLPTFWKVRFLKFLAFFMLETGMQHKKTGRPSAQNAQIESLLNNNKRHMFPLYQ